MPGGERDNEISPKGTRSERRDKKKRRESSPMGSTESYGPRCDVSVHATLFLVVTVVVGCVVGERMRKNERGNEKTAKPNKNGSC